MYDYPKFLPLRIEVGGIMLLADLERLEMAQLIRRVTAEPELAYLFKHVLVQETVHDSLLHKKRRELHRQVAQALEQLYPKQLDEYAALLARHYSEAGDDAKTFEYALRAGDSAGRLQAHAEARTHYALALNSLARLPDGDARRRHTVDTLIKQVSVTLHAVAPQTSLERLHQAETLLGTLGGDPSDRSRRAHIHYWIAHAYIHGNQPAKSIEYMQRVLQEAQELNDPELLAIPASVIGRALVIQGRFARAAVLLTQALGPLEQVENWHEWILAHGRLALALSMQGALAEAVQRGQQALARATAMQTLTGIAQSHAFLGWVYWAADDWPQTLTQSQLAEQAAVHSADHFLRYISIGLRGLALMQAKDFEASERALAELEGLRQRIGGRLVFALWFSAARSASLFEQGRLPEAHALVQQTLNEARAAGDIFTQGWLERVQGQIDVRLEPLHFAQADTHFEEGLHLFEEGDARLEAARTHVTWGKILGERGDDDAAREHLEKAAAQFETSGLTRELGETRTLLHAEVD